MPLKFIDIAVNLTDPAFVGLSRAKNPVQVHESDFDLVLERFRAIGGERIVISGTSYEDSVRAIEMCKSNPGLLQCTVGCHPAHCTEFAASEELEGGSEAHLKKYIELVEAERQHIVAVGEMGLDYSELEMCPKDIQLQYFEMQLRLAQCTGLPVFFHSRDCGLDFVEILERNRGSFGKGGVVHSFTGSEEELRRILDLGLYVSVNGASFRTKEQLELLIRGLPLERTIIETDAPWCDVRSSHAGWGSVQTKWQTKKKEKFERGKCVDRRNEPCHLRQIAEILHATREQSGKGGTLEEVAAACYGNTIKLFYEGREDIAPPSSPEEPPPEGQK